MIYRITQLDHTFNDHIQRPSQHRKAPTLFLSDLISLLHIRHIPPSCRVRMLESRSFYVLSEPPVRAKSSVCVMCLKYRIIINIISLGQILLSQTHLAHRDTQ